VLGYKTGKKKLSLTDVLNGRDMQMLIYLNALKKLGRKRYGNNIIPAGVMYVPARDNILDMPRNSTDESIKEKREKSTKRNGLMLNDPAVIEAMETSEIKRFLPVKYTKDGMQLSDDFITFNQSKIISNHVDKMLKRAVNEITRGNINCTPYYKNPTDNACFYCEYKSVCAFDTQMGDMPHFIKKLKNDEVWEKLTEQGM
jgi:ATP-dependent helicase/nuclease subunit B